MSESTGNDVGRPPIITDQVILKLEEAFLMGCTDLEACLFAGISKTPFYTYQDEHPEFKERKELLKENPFIIARKAITDGLKDNEEFSLKYMKNKKNKEFNERQGIVVDIPDNLSVSLNLGGAAVSTVKADPDNNKVPVEITDKKE
jgi:hypothetical protein